MPNIKIKKVDGTDPKIGADLVHLQYETFPADPLQYPNTGHWWIAYDDKKPIAFIGLVNVETWPKAAYLARVGVLPSHRGNGLQRRLMSVCERRAKELGFKTLISTTRQNPPSANSFVARKWKTYEPQNRWGAEDTIYWIKQIQ